MRERGVTRAALRRVSISVQALAFVLLSFAMPVPVFAAQDPGPVQPSGYTLTGHGSIARGIEHSVLVKQEPAEAIHVARIAPDAPYEFRAVLGQGMISGQGTLERTSSMCARVSCAVAVNADFFTPKGAPVGALAIDGEPVQSPNRKHHQLVVEPDGDLRLGQIKWKGQLVPSDLKPIAFSKVNVERRTDAIVLYTPWFGSRTGTNKYGVELVATVLEPGGPMAMDQTVLVRLERLVKGGNSSIPTDGIVLSGHGKAATTLEALWTRVKGKDAARNALLRVDSTPDVAQTVGGTPILVRDGKRWVSDDGHSFTRSRHPRTMVGWTETGERLLVTVDGRQPGYSAGMSLFEAADLMISLGAVHAINLDGGGSTTFVVQGEVVNRPSDRVASRNGVKKIVRSLRSGDTLVGNAERPVSTALALVPVGKAAVAAQQKQAGLARGSLALPKPVALPTPHETDAASDPAAALPAIVLVAPVPPASRALLAWWATLLALVMAGAHLRRALRPPD